MVLNLLKSPALGLVAEEGDVADAAEADGGEQPEHASLGDAVHQRRERQRYQEGQRPAEAGGYATGSSLHLGGEQLTCGGYKRCVHHRKITYRLNRKGRLYIAQCTMHMAEGGKKNVVW